MSLNKLLENIIIVTEMSLESSSGPLTSHTCHGEEQLTEKEKTQMNKLTLKITNQFFGLSFFDCRVGLLPAFCRAQHLDWRLAEAVRPLAERHCMSECWRQLPHSSSRRFGRGGGAPQPLCCAPQLLMLTPIP